MDRAEYTEAIKAITRSLDDIVFIANLYQDSSDLTKEQSLTLTKMYNLAMTGKLTIHNHINDEKREDKRKCNGVG